MLVPVRQAIHPARRKAAEPANEIPEGKTSFEQVSRHFDALPNTIRAWMAKGMPFELLDTTAAEEKSEDEHKEEKPEDEQEPEK
jgi:hypothetical protein